MVKYSPFSDEVMNDPYPVYAQLRAEDPVHYIEEFDAWAFSKFQDIWDCSMDNKHFTATKGTTAAHVLTKVQPVTPMLNMMDPPEHTKLRSEMRQFFTPANVAPLEPFIRDIAQRYIGEAKERGSMEVMGEYSANVATAVACKLNGIPQEDGPMLNDLVWRFFARDPEIDGMTPDGLAAMTELGGYFYQLASGVREKGADGDDVLNLLCRFELNGEKFDLETIASHLTLLIIGGAETFPKTFANVTRLLAEHPDQRAQVVANPALVPDAFQEALRYWMPTQFLCRTVTNEKEIRGKTLQPGQPVLFLYPSANRDDDEFDDPNKFDIGRQAKRILSFGAGTHGCIGIHAARLEAKVCLEEMLAAFPEYEIDLDKADRLVTDFVQGYASFPVTF